MIQEMRKQAKAPFNPASLPVLTPLFGATMGAHYEAIAGNA
jgi:hypothetical protein